MMLTEAEARTKWCPMADAAGLSMEQMCRGAKCMGWRIGKPAVPAYPGDVYARCISHGRAGKIEEFYRAGTERPAEPEKGFCGLFGRDFGGAA